MKTPTTKELQRRKQYYLDNKEKLQKYQKTRYQKIIADKKKTE
jgi:hypothetical protein